MPLRLLAGPEFLTNEPAPEWIMEPFCVPGSSLMLYGRQGSGKSTLAYQMAHALATGHPWLNFPVWRTGPVVYLQFDMPRYEWTMLLHRAQPDYPVVPTLYLNHRDTDNDLSRVNILAIKEYREVADVLATVQPHALIVDTISEGFAPMRALQHDINEEAREVIRLWHTLVPEGVFVFLKHERKGAVWKANASEDAEEDDLDAFSGPAGWETKVTTSLRLTNRNGQARLRVQKCRLADPGFRSMALGRDSAGFFTAPLGHEQLLATWPRLLPPAARFTPQTVADVLRDVAERSGEPFETVKKAYQRARSYGKVFAWAEALGDKV